MIDGLKPYPKVKDSGVPWLGNVPEHWEVKSIGRMGRLFKGNGGSKEDEVAVGVPCVRYGDLYTRHEFFIEGTKACVSTDRAEAYTPIEYGDLLFAASGETMEDIGRSSVNLLRGPACCGGDILVLRPGAPVNPRFLGYASDAPSSRHQKATMGRGFTVIHVYASQIKQLALPLPPLPEQAAIVRFLDHANRIIRRYIRAKKKLITLLNEQKQAIIHQAVTRGLDPDVKLKPSGIALLGDVPKHWEVRQVRAIAQVVRGGSPRPAGSLLYFHGTDIPWITVGEITKDNRIYLTGTSTRLTPLGATHSRLIEPGTLLLTNSGATLGIPKISHVKGCINDGVAAFLRLKSTVCREFLYHYWTTQTVHLKAWVDLGAQPNLNTQIIGGWPIPLPPLNEQEEIVVHITQANDSFTIMIESIQNELNLLREYRARLIADVITGKLDIREAAARLPDDVAEEEIDSFNIDEEAAEEADGLGDPDLEGAVLEAGA